MTNVRVLVGVAAALLLVGFAAGCGLVSDQAKQEVKKKVEAKGQQAEQEVKKELQAGKEDMKKRVDELQRKVEVAKEDLEKKVDELLKKVDAQQQQDQKTEK